MKFIDTLSEQANVIRNQAEIYMLGEYEIKINPLTVSQLIAISPHISQVLLEGDIKTPEDWHNIVVPQIERYLEPIRKVFDILIDYEFDKFLPVDIMNILLIITKQMGTKDFLNSIMLIKNISRNAPTEIIAAEKNFSIQ